MSFVAKANRQLQKSACGFKLLFSGWPNIRGNKGTQSNYAKFYGNDWVTNITLAQILRQMSRKSERSSLCILKADSGRIVYLC